MEKGFPTMTPNPEATKKMLSFFKICALRKDYMSIHKC